MNPITNDTVMEFIRMLVNLGGVDMLKEPEMLILNPCGEPRCITEGDKTKPIQIIVPGMVKDDSNFLFNPFKCVEGNNPAYVWFYMSRGSNIAVTVKRIMTQLIELAVAKESPDYDVVQLISDISASCDKQMIEELQKINPADIIRIFYNKKTKTAEAQSPLLTDEVETQYKLRKKSWSTIRQIFKTIFELKEDEATMSAYQYRALILSIPEIDAKLHVISKIIAKLAKWSTLIGVTFEPEAFEEHLKNLESYARMYAWFTARTVKDQTIISNQTRSSGLPLKPIETTPDDTTIKLTTVMPTQLQPSNNSIPLSINSAPLSINGSAAPLSINGPVLQQPYTQPMYQPATVDMTNGVPFVPDRIPLS